MMTKPEHADVDLPMSTNDLDAEWMWAKVEANDMVNGNFTPVAEGRCDGMSFAVKKARPAHRPHHDGDKPAPPADDLDAMLLDAEGTTCWEHARYTPTPPTAAVDEEVHAVEHPGWVPSWVFPQLAPPELFAKEQCDHEDAPEDAPEEGPEGPDAPPHGPPHKGPHPPHGPPPGPPPKMPGHCHLRCNHRPAFGHGAMPCFGVFEADCHFRMPHHGHHKHNETHDDTSNKRTLLHWHEDGPDGPHHGHHGKGKGKHCHHKGGAHLVARCEGMFTGRFMGTKCRGFSFGTVTTPRVQLVATCSKGQYMHAGPMRGGFGMVSVCSDKAMMVVLRGEHEHAAGDEDVVVA